MSTKDSKRTVGRATRRTAKVVNKNTDKKESKKDVKPVVIGRRRKGRSYGVASIAASDMVAAANKGRGAEAVQRPVIKIDDYNQRFLGDIFELPDPKNHEEDQIQVAYRILGFPLTEKLMNHMHGNITSDDLNRLIPFYPFSFHRRFGKTYTDRVCPSSTRTSDCPICEGRRELFGSIEYERNLINKDDIMGASFGTRSVCVFFAYIYVDGAVIGPNAVMVNVTNPMARHKRKDNFFDLVDDLTKGGQIITSEQLPDNYYDYGDSGRWLVATYNRAIYAGDGGGSATNPKPRKTGHPYWKLAKITPVQSIEDYDAAEIWWPEVEESDSGETDVTFLVDPYEVINHTPDDELDKIAKDAIDYVLRKASGAKELIDDGDDDGDDDFDDRDDGGVTNHSGITWAELSEMDEDELIDVGVDAGGDEDQLETLADSNIAALRRNVAKLIGVSPTAVR